MRMEGNYADGGILCGWREIIRMEGYYADGGNYADGGILCGWREIMRIRTNYVDPANNANQTGCALMKTVSHIRGSRFSKFKQTLQRRHIDFVSIRIMGRVFFLLSSTAISSI